MNDLTLIRAGFKSTGFTAGHAEVDIAGMFSQEDIADIVALLEMTIRRIRRVAAPPVATPITQKEVEK